MNTIAEEWMDYAKRVLPRDAPGVQYIETRRVFFAGYYSCLASCRFVIGDESVSEDEAVALLEARYQECLRFFEDVKAGRA